MTSLCLLKQESIKQHQQAAQNINPKDVKSSLEVPQTRKSQKLSNSDLNDVQIEPKYINNKPRATSYNQKHTKSKLRQNIGREQESDELSKVDTIELGNTNYLKSSPNRRQTLTMTGQEFEQKKLQVCDLDEEQKMQIVKRLCNHKAVKTTKDNQLIYDILKDNEYIKYLKEAKGDTFILSKVIPSMKVVHKRQGEIIYEQDTISLGFFVVIKGECEGRMRNNQTGQSRFILDKYIEGTEFGNIEMLDQKTRIQTIISKTETWLMFFDYNIQKQHFSSLQRSQLEYLIDIMNQFPCFQNYGRRNLLNFLPFFTFQVYNRNQKVYSICNATDYIYFIISGDFKVYQKVSINSEMTLDQLLNMPSRLITEEKDKYTRSIEVAVLNSAQIFGEEEIIQEEEKRKQEVICTSSVGQVLLLHKEDYEFKFAKDSYFNEIFTNLVESKRQFREQRLREIQNLTKTILSSQDQNYNKNVIEKKIKNKLEDKLLDFQKKGLHKQKFDSHLSQQVQQIQDVFSQSSSPSPTSKRHHSSPNSPTQLNKKKQKSEPRQQRIQEKVSQVGVDQIGNSIVFDIGNDKNKVYSPKESKLQLYCLSSQNENQILNNQNTPQINISQNQKCIPIDQMNISMNQTTIRVGKETIPASLIQKGVENQYNKINILPESSKITNQIAYSPNASHKQNSSQYNQKHYQNLGKTEELYSSQNLWLCNKDAQFSNTLNMKNSKLKSTLDKSDFYGTDKKITTERCETSPSRQRTKMNSNNSITETINDMQNYSRLQSDNSERVGSSTLYKQHRSKSNQPQYLLDPIAIPPAIPKLSKDNRLEIKLQSVFYNNKLNLLNYSPQKYQQEELLLEENSQYEVGQIQDDIDMNNNRNESYSKYTQQQQISNKSKIIRSPQDEPPKIYDPTGVNKYLRRIFYGKGRRKQNQHTECNDECYEQYCQTQPQSCSPGRKSSPEKRNASLEEKMIRQFRQGKKENQMRINFQQVLKIVDKKNLKVHLHKKNLLKDLGEKEKYNSYIKPQGMKKEFLCFEYVNQRLSSQNTVEQESYAKYDQMVQLEYQKFKSQNNEIFEHTPINKSSKQNYSNLIQNQLNNDGIQLNIDRNQLINDGIQFSSEYNQFNTEGNQINQFDYEGNICNSPNNNISGINPSQLHNFRGTSYTKKRKILRIVNDPETKKATILNISSIKKNETLPSTNCNQNNLLLTQTQYPNKSKSLPQNNYPFSMGIKQDEPYSLHELLKTKDIIPNCFIPHSQEPHFKKFLNKKNNNYKVESAIRNPKKTLNQFNQIQQMAEQLLLQSSPNKLQTLDR